MPKSPLAPLIKLVKKLRKDRQKHAAAIAQIDSALGELGIAEPAAAPAAPAPRRGRPPGRPKGSAKKVAKAGKKRKRGSFKETASELVLGLLKEKSLTTAEINGVWKKAGRPGLANNTLTKLAKEKKIKGTKVKGGRGSSYTVA